MAKIELFYRILVHDKKGKLVRRTRLRKSKSFVIAFLQHFEVMANHVYDEDGASVNIINTSGALKACASAGNPSNKYYSLSCPDDSSSYGIVVGSGSTPPDNLDYALETLITHGVGAGQLDYGAHNWTTTAEIGANVDLVISRTYYNGSGSTITVNEIGIVVLSFFAIGANAFLLIRDVLGAGVDVLDTQTLTVQYTLRTTV